MGSAQIPVAQVWKIILYQLPGMNHWMTPDWPDSSEQILMNIRFPRIVLSLLVGAALAIAGAAFQGILRNPLADPYTLGVASGASVGAAFLILFGLQYMLFGQWTIPIFAFITATISLFIVLRLASYGGKIQKETVILSGVVIQAFLGAVVSLMVALSSKVINEIIYWLMGSLAFKGWIFSAVLFPYLTVGVIIVVCYGRTLNLFALGERQAAHLGVHIERTKFIVLLTATFLTAAAVSVSGIIGFVGLVIPHLIRLCVGPDYRLILPLSIIYGGIFLLWADTIARMMLSPMEIPLGVVTAFLGAPFFAYLLTKHKKKELM
jgi:iron complex transport system permease protein